MTLSEFIKELKHNSIWIGILYRNADKSLFIDKLGVLIHWVDYPKYMNRKIISITPMYQMTGLFIEIEEK